MLVNDRSGEVHGTSFILPEKELHCAPLSVRKYFQFTFSMFTSGFENEICKLSCKTIVRMKGNFTRKKHGGAKGLKKSCPEG